MPTDGISKTAGKLPPTPETEVTTAGPGATHSAPQSPATVAPPPEPEICFSDATADPYFQDGDDLVCSSEPTFSDGPATGYSSAPTGVGGGPGPSDVSGAGPTSATGIATNGPLSPPAERAQEKLLDRLGAESTPLDAWTDRVPFGNPATSWLDSLTPEERAALPELVENGMALQSEIGAVVAGRSDAPAGAATSGEPAGAIAGDLLDRAQRAIAHDVAVEVHDRAVNLVEDAREGAQRLAGSGDARSEFLARLAESGDSQEEMATSLRGLGMEGNEAEQLAYVLHSSQGDDARVEAIRTGSLPDTALFDEALAEAAGTSGERMDDLLATMRQRPDDAANWLTDPNLSAIRDEVLAERGARPDGTDGVSQSVRGAMTGAREEEAWSGLFRHAVLASTSLASGGLGPGGSVGRVSDALTIGSDAQAIDVGDTAVLVGTAYADRSEETRGQLVADGAGIVAGEVRGRALDAIAGAVAPRVGAELAGSIPIVGDIVSAGIDIGSDLSAYQNAGDLSDVWTGEGRRTSSRDALTAEF